MFKKKTENTNEVVLDSPQRTISNMKRIWIMIAGIGGLVIFGLIGGAIAKSIPGLNDGQINGVTNFITYAMIFVTILAILNKDIILLKTQFNKILPYVIGVVVGFAMIGFQYGYSAFVNLFYNTGINDNEAALEQFIPLYPACSIIFLCIIGPACEEFTYRFGLFSIFGKHKVPAYIVSILVFAFMHFNPASENIVNELINLPVYLVSAAALTITYDKLGFVGSYSAHVVNNLWSVIGILITTNMR